VISLEKIQHLIPPTGHQKHLHLPLPGPGNLQVKPSRYLAVRVILREQQDMWQVSVDGHI
jgi:hypothetical protein